MQSEIVEKTVELLNDGDFSQSFTAAWPLIPEPELKALKVLDVSVVPAGVLLEPHNRAQLKGEYSADIAVRQKLPELTVEALKDLMTLSEEVARFMLDQRLSTTPAALCTKVQLLPDGAPYIYEHLREFHQFTRLIRCTFQVLEARSRK